MHDSLQPTASFRRGPFLSGVFLLSAALLTFQIVQTRILSVLVWYYMAFFAISVAMLGMTAGAVLAYVRRDWFEARPLPVVLSDFTLYTAIAIPLSVILQFCLITEVTVSIMTVIAWALLMAAMAAPYLFAGVVISLALTRSPFPRGVVYGADLIGAAFGCFAVIALLNFLDGPSAVIATGCVAALASAAFARGAGANVQLQLAARPRWRRPLAVACVLALFTALNAVVPVAVRPVLVKGKFEGPPLHRFERWNSYSRIAAQRPAPAENFLWGPSRTMPADIHPTDVFMDIDGAAGTNMFHYTGSAESVSFLKYDLVTIAYRFPGIQRAAIIGVGGGRDVMAANLFGVRDITGVELNPIFIDLLTRDPFYSKFANVNALPNLHLHVDDARSWFASTGQKFDLVQMSMIDTWAATGAGAFSLSENGLYTLEGWRAFLNTLRDGGIFTVSRWYSPGDVNETGRMIGLATAALHDRGIQDVRPYLFVTGGGNIATLVLRTEPFTQEQLAVLEDAVKQLQFKVLVAPGQPPESDLLRRITESTDNTGLNTAVASSYLDLTVPTDNRPFFFNQLRFHSLPGLAMQLLRHNFSSKGVLAGNVMASAVLMLILCLAVVAVLGTVVLPLREAVAESATGLIVAGSLYFSLIGMGFMLAEIALLQKFSVYLGHPIYSLSVCLSSLILSSGLGSIVSDRIRLDRRGKLLGWGGLVLACILLLERLLPELFLATTGRERAVRIVIALAAIMPLGFLLGFAFPTGIRLVEAVDSRPTPWFWGINGATGVLASVLGVMLSMAFGINATLLLAGVCYLLLLPVGLALLRMNTRAAV